MTKDKFTATWVSHSSISEYLKCPRAYYLKNVYKDSKTNHKIQIMSPPLALGSAVHEVLEALSVIPTGDRFKKPLIKKFNQIWEKKFEGKKGGFFDKDIEQKYKERGEEMIRRVKASPGPIKRLAVKIKQDLPFFWLSEDENIILCGKIDWLEYLPESDSVHIIDFKTGKKEEDKESLQLPIYHLLVHNCQQRDVDKASYWYLAFNDELTEKELPDLEVAYDKVLAIAKKIKTARALKTFKCPHGKEGCYACRDMERILKGDGDFVGVSDYGTDVYVLKKKSSSKVEHDSVII
jgi:ATP-dependent helicase/DNAse subunit B